MVSLFSQTQAKSSIVNALNGAQWQKLQESSTNSQASKISLISTRLTKKLGIDHPVIQAPMAFAAGGKLASAVSSAGGLGLIGSADGDIDWLSEQFEVADNPKIGCGFIAI